MKEAIIFDVDGVLLDSFDVQIKCYKEIARRLGVKEPGRDVIEESFGFRLEKKSKLLFGSEDEKIIDIYKEIRSKMENDIKVMDGLEEFLNNLKAKKAIVTSRTKESLERSFGNFLKFFSVIVTEEYTEKLKPNPDPLLLACERLDVIPGKAVYVGDTIIDYRAAKNAGMGFIGFTSGCTPKERFEEVGAKSVSSLKELSGEFE
ncbi:MAG: HAD family phosphatase [Nitrospirota bacterium]